MYLRLLAINNAKHVPLDRVLSFENSPVPLSMFNIDGTMITTQKSIFMHKLEAILPDPAPVTVTNIDSIVIDGNTVVRALPSSKVGLEKPTYSDLASWITSSASPRTSVVPP